MFLVRGNPFQDSPLEFLYIKALRKFDARQVSAKIVECNRGLLQVTSVVFQDYLHGHLLVQLLFGVDYPLEILQMLLGKGFELHFQLLSRI